MECKFKAGQYWSTRDGRKVYITGVSETVNPFTGEDIKFPVTGVIEDDDDEHNEFTLDGRYFSGMESPHDLVSPWKDETSATESDGYPWGTLYIKDECGAIRPLTFEGGTRVFRVSYIDR